MPDLTPEEKIKLAVSFIEQSPPGEVNDVVNDIRAIVGDDDALMPHAVPALRAYNLAQLQVVEHPAAVGVQAHTSLLSEASIVPNTSPERFYDHEAARTFIFDHVTLQPSDYEPVELPAADAAFRSALAASLGKYARNHFPSGHASVSTNQIPVSAAPASPDADMAAVSQAVPGASSPAPSANANANDDAAADEADEAAERARDPGDQSPVEQHPSGITEEDPTPVFGTVERQAQDEVDASGGLEKLDDEVQAEARAEAAAEAGETKDDDDEPAEKHPSGIAEEESTPVVGTPERRADDEVDADGGLARLDEEVKEAQAEIDAGEEDAVHAAKEERALAAEDACDAAEESAEAGAGATAGQSAPTAPPPLDNPTFTLEIVGNRFNPSNFWTGRWRTRWVVDRAKGAVEGVIKVDVHYYEQGNVQLATEHRASFELPADAADDAAVASAVVTNIGKIETEYQHELGDVYSSLGDKAFRALRRALPVTRQKVDWDKVSGYSIGNDISKAFV